ncbi:hypothetical protein IWX50DRAFT_436698 [Phyllosticta citricarpa]
MGKHRERNTEQSDTRPKIRPAHAHTHPRTSSKPFRKARLAHRTTAQNAASSLLSRRRTRQGSDALGTTASIAGAALSTPATTGHGDCAAAGQAVGLAAARRDAADVAVDVEAVARLFEEVVVLTAHAAADAIAGTGAATRQTAACCCCCACVAHCCSCCVTAGARQAAHADVCCGRPKVVSVAVVSRRTGTHARAGRRTRPAEHGGEETRCSRAAARRALAAAVFVAAPRVRRETWGRSRRDVRS